MIKRIVLVPHTHTDIGYTGLPNDVAIQHVRHIRRAIDLCEREPSYRWALETAWTLELFLRHAAPDEVARLRRLMRAGRIELTGFYVQPLTQLCGLDELEANFAFTRDLGAEVGATADTVVIDDIGGLSASVPQAMRCHGLRYLVNGCGGWRTMVPFVDLPHLFRLTGPDGSHILCYHLGDDVQHRQPGGGPAQYGFGIIYFLWPLLKDPADRKTMPRGELPLSDLRGREGIDLLLARLERDGYPYDTLLLQTATDNAGPYDKVPEAVREWNRRCASPTVEIGTFSGFFRDLEKRYGRRIPKVTGEWTCSWTEHAITYGRATGRYRDARRRLARWAAIEAAAGKATNATAHEWRETLRRLTLFSDHTFGISMWLWADRVKTAGSVWHDSLDTPRDSWETKRAYVEDALAHVRRAEDNQAHALTTDDRDRPTAITAVNPHSFAFTGTVRFTSKQANIALTTADGRALPVDSQTINTEWHQHTTRLTGLPPFGAQTLRVVAAETPAAPVFRAAGHTLAGPGVVVTLDPKTGTVTSVRTGAGRRAREWVSADSAGLNDVLWFGVNGVTPLPVWGGMEEPDVRFDRVPPCGARRLAGGDGACHCWVTFERRFQAGRRTMQVVTQYTLDGTGLRIRNTVRKVHDTEKEACFFGFPFALKPGFRVDVEQQGTLTRFPDERLPGGTNHDLGVQDFVSLADDRAQAVLTSLQACLISFQAPTYYHYSLDFLKIEAPTVYSYAFNNLWNTNCPILQDGELVFEYHVSLLPHGFSPVAAFQASRTAARLPAVFCGAPPAPAAEPAFVSVDSAAVLVESVRPAGDGIWEMRLVEIARQPTRCGLRINAERFAEFALADTAIEPPAWRPVRKTPVRLAFRPAQFRVLRLRERQ